MHSRDNKVDNFASSCFCCLVFWERLGDPYVFQSPIGVYVLLFRTGAGLCIYHWFVYSNVNFLHIFQCITLPTRSCLVLYSFCANLLHSLIMWLMASSLSPHSLHLLFRWVLSILALIWLAVMALFYIAIKRDSVSLLKFPFLSHVQVLSCEILFVEVVVVIINNEEEMIDSDQWCTKNRVNNRNQTIWTNYRMAYQTLRMKITFAKYRKTSKSRSTFHEKRPNFLNEIRKICLQLSSLFSYRLHI